MAEGGESRTAQEWLPAFRRACDRIGDAVGAMAPEERGEPRGRGAGGDVTILADRIAEDIVLEELGALGRPLRVLSEEVGAVAVGGGGEGDPLVVVDPIDGSVNAKRGLPLFSTSIALAEGPTMADVLLGIVRDHGTGEEWLAERGRGALLGGTPLGPRPPLDPRRLQLLMMEGATPARVARAAGRLDGRVRRLRALGSLALSLCHTAAGRADAMVGLGPARAVDVAAAQLVVQETGLLVGVPHPEDLAATPLDMAARFRMTAAHDYETIDLLRGLSGR